MQQGIFIENGMIFDPDGGSFSTGNIVIHHGVIAKIGPHVMPDPSMISASYKTIDATGLTVVPGLVDLHVHFREPGQTHKEDMTSGARAAARGGVTSVLMMPNTAPPIDDPELCDMLCERARNHAPIRVYPSCTITKQMQGVTMTDLAAMQQAGAIACTEDGKSVLSEEILKEAMVIAARLGMTVHSHCEDPALAGSGVMNDDHNAARLHLPGIPNAAEDVIVERDIRLAKETGAHLHICHCSTAGSVALVRKAKEEGISVTAETCPHYLVLTSDDIPSDDANWKMNPPLRKKEDRAARVEALRDGTIDCIVTDHAPHAPEEKRHGFTGSPFGIVGLETSASLIYTELVRTGVLSMEDMVRLMSTTPARIAHLSAGTLAEGMPADVALFDLSASYVIDPDDFASKSRNTPFAGRTVYGKTVMTICDGEIVYTNGENK